VIARRAGDVWYIGGLSGQADASTATVPLDFLGAGEWTAAIIRDGASDRTFDTDARGVTSKDHLTIPVRGRGGFVVTLHRR
jgi:alpha-glucosidase